MFDRQKNFLKGFASVSPVIPALLFSAAALLAQATAAGATEPAAGTLTVKRQAAEAQFSRAEEERAALNSKDPEKRSLAEYKRVVSSYRRVYLITPHSTDVPESLVAIGELYSEMGDRFGRSYYQSAVDSYQFLLHEYPKSRYGQDVLLRIARLERDQLGDPRTAAKTYEDFLKRYPRAAQKREAQEALAELSLLRNGEESEAAKSTRAPRGGQPGVKQDDEPEPRSVRDSGRTTPVSSGEIPRVRRISAAASPDSTRVTIDLEDAVQYTSGRIANPDRIFFDLHAARLTPEIAHGTVRVSGDLLTAVRVAQNQSGVVRVVLDLHGVKDYTASLLHNPPQLVIDLYRNAAAMRAARKTRPEDAEEPQEAASREPGDSVQTVASRSNPAEPNPAPARSQPAARERPATARPGKSGAKPDLVRPASSPELTRDGGSTLTRALGLKIGRIVIDAGHGGHDTGTIGPTGLMEKDLCLDVALRLGKIIQQRLPGADVVFTREDDTFIPLEERTRLANQAKADLFISIHANSSHDRVARGIETYYLNLKGSAEAMEVAARENATSQEAVHDLQDLVRQIARTEKIDESREFAADIQDSLAKRVQKTAKNVKNRGVRKAPFVVLIGADMPSVLTEISFLSNPADEQMLKKPDYRQRLAEGLYQGVASYLQSLNSVTVNLGGKPLPVRTPAPSAVEESRNQK